MRRRSLPGAGWISHQRWALIIGLALSASGCCTDPWRAFKMPVAPDSEFSTGGGTHGDDVYVWNCVHGEHVIIYQYSAELTCFSPVRESVPCREHTPHEKEIPPAAIEPARPGRGWQL